MPIRSSLAPHLLLAGAALAAESASSDRDCAVADGSRSWQSGGKFFFSHTIKVSDWCALRAYASAP
eukprot:5423514-Prymnesium_polylepis.1